MKKIVSKNFKVINPDSIDEYIGAGGFDALKKSMEKGSDFVINEVKASKLMGRGGAQYPTGVKWEQVRAAEPAEKVVICNADEGEPCTFKDRYLLEYDPYRIIEGMTLCGYAIGAKEGYIYIREEYKHLQRRMKKAIQASIDKGFLGDSILGKDFSFSIKVVSGAGAYVCGDETALLNSIEGKRGEPRIKPPYPSKVGLWSKPTCVNNVETFAYTPSIINMGAEEYTKIGTECSKGTKLVSLAGNVKNPGAYEVPFGTTIREIIYELGGGVKNDRDIKFIQVGGASGAILPKDKLDLKYSYEDLEKEGVSIGSGAILVADETRSVLDFMKSVQDFFLHESCGKCTPCREGNRQMSKIINRFVVNEGKVEDIDTAYRFARVMKTCSFCGLGQTAPTALLSAIKHFRSEFDNHIAT